MGMTEAGAYDANVTKWSDFSNRIGDMQIDFEWAPYAADQLAKVRNIIGRRVRPDLVVMGGGAWDRLHKYNTYEEKESFQGTVSELVAEMNRARSQGIPIAWTVQTTINSKALLTEEKRNNIKEEDMAEIRAIYDHAGVTNMAAFVLDGPSFTAGRVSESYDGVHYPLSVYEVGAQILANAMDWLLVEREEEIPPPPQPGSMANPLLGIMMLCVVFVCLVCCDGLMGFSYLACVFVRGVAPGALYDEAFDDLHERKNIPMHGPIKRSKSSPVPSEVAAVPEHNGLSNSTSDVPNHKFATLLGPTANSRLGKSVVR
jgi:hypothetical protein